MTNKITGYPVGILKPPPKRVKWGHEQTKVFRQDEWENKPLLNTHETKKREAQIKSLPLVKTPVAPPAPIRKPPPPRPKWNWWQKIARGEDAVGMAICGGMLTLCLAPVLGPFVAIIPASFVVYVAGVWLYRKYGPQARQLAREQEVNGRLAEKYTYKARTMRRIGNIEQAKIYEQLVRRLK